MTKRLRMIVRHWIHRAMITILVAFVAVLPAVECLADGPAATIRLEAVPVSLVIANLDRRPGFELAVLTEGPWPKDPCGKQPPLVVPPCLGVVRVYSIVGTGRIKELPCAALLYLEEDTQCPLIAGTGYTIVKNTPVGLRYPQALFPIADGLVAFGVGGNVWEHALNTWKLLEDRCRLPRAPAIHGFTITRVGEHLPKILPLNWDRFQQTRQFKDLVLHFSHTHPLYGVGNFDGLVGRTFVLLSGEPSDEPAERGKYPLRIFQRGELGYKEIQTLFVGGRGAAPGLLGVSDVNDDGYDDLVITLKGPLADRIHVFLANGDGTFRQALQETYVHEEACGLLFGDFDESGTVDLLLVGPKTTRFLPGLGNGGFEKGGLLEFGITAEDDLMRCLAARLNRDRFLDVAIADKGEVRIYYGKGDGRFSKGPELKVGEMVGSKGFAPSALYAAELDGKPGVDLIVVSKDTEEIAILLSRGDGTFAPVERPLVGPGVNVAVAAYFDADDKMDVARLHPLTAEVSILWGVRPEVASPTESTIELGDLVYPVSIAAGDFNNDKNMDLAVACYASDTVSVVYGPLGPDRKPAPPVPILVGKGPTRLVSLPGSGAGHQLVVLNELSHNAYLLEYDPKARGMRVVRRVQLDPNPTWIEAADLNGDGALDLVVLYQDAGKIEALWGVTGFEARETLAGPGTALKLTQPMMMWLGDLDRDEVPDIVVIEPERIKVLRGVREQIREKRMYRLLRETWVSALRSPTTSLTVADLNGDRQLDMAVSSYAKPYIVVFYGVGGGTFTKIEPDKIEFSKLDRTKITPVGLGFLVAVAPRLLGFSEFQATPDSTLWIRFDIDDDDDDDDDKQPGIIIHATMGDLTGDGLADLVLLLPERPGQPQPEIRVISGTDLCSLRDQAQVVKPIILEAGISLVEAADVDGDKHTDIVALNRSRGTLTIYWGPRYTERKVMPVRQPIHPLLTARRIAERTFVLVGATTFIAEKRAFRSVELDVGDGRPRPKSVVFGGVPGAVSHLGLLVEREARQYEVLLFDLGLVGGGSGKAVARILVAGKVVGFALADLNQDRTVDVAVVYADREEGEIFLGCLDEKGLLRFRPEQPFTFPTGQRYPRYPAALISSEDDRLRLVVAGRFSTYLTVFHAFDGKLQMEYLALKEGFRDVDVILVGLLVGEPAVIICHRGTNKVTILCPKADREITKNIAGIEVRVLPLTRQPGPTIQLPPLVSEPGPDDTKKVEDEAARECEVLASLELFSPTGVVRLVSVQKLPNEMVAYCLKSNSLAFLRVGGLPSLPLVLARAVNLPTLPGTPRWREMMAGDFCGDGYTDVVFFDPTVATLLVLWGTDPPEACHYPLPGGPASVGVADVSGDGVQDLVVSLPDAGQVLVLVSQRERRSFQPWEVPFPGRPGKVVAADFTRDGRADIAVVDLATGRVQVLVSEVFPRDFRVLTIPTPSDLRVEFVLVHDLNGDGREDFVAICRAVDDTGAMYQAVPVLVHMDMSFVLQTRVAIGWDTWTGVLADLTGDGLTDLVVVDGWFRILRVYLGNGAGAFSEEPVVFVTEREPRWLATVDANGDGILDLLVSGFLGKVCVVWGTQGEAFRMLHGTEAACLALGG